MPMKLINSKSILDCDEIEEEVHNQENNEFIEKLFDLPDYECAALFKRTDMNDADSEATIKPCSLHDCFEMDGIWIHLNWVGHIVILYPCMERLITQTKLQERFLLHTQKE